MDCVTPEVKINVNSSGYLMNVDVWVSKSYFQVLNFCFLHFCGGEGTYLPLVGFRPVSDHFTVLDSVWSLGTQLYSVGFSQSRIGVKSMFASVVFSVLGPLRPGISELLEAIHKESQPGAFLPCMQMEKKRKNWVSGQTCSRCSQAIACRCRSNPRCRRIQICKPSWSKFLLSS